MQRCSGVVQGGAGFQCTEEGGQGWTGSTIGGGMGSPLSSAYKVFEEKLVRTNFFEFCKILQGCDPQIGGHLPVALVCQVGLVWSNSKK